MDPERPPSDSALIVGALFVACTAAGVGLLADPASSQQASAIWSQSMLAATAAPQGCRQEIKGEPTEAASTQCVSGCTYQVLPGSFFGEPKIVAGGTPDGKRNPALIFVHYASTFVAPGDATYQQWACPEGSKIGDFAKANRALNAWLGEQYGIEGAVGSSLGGSTASNVPLSSVTSTVGQPTNLLPSNWTTSDTSPFVSNPLYYCDLDKCYAYGSPVGGNVDASARNGSPAVAPEGEPIVDLSPNAPIELTIPPTRIPRPGELVQYGVIDPHSGVFVEYDNMHDPIRASRPKFANY